MKQLYSPQRSVVSISSLHSVSIAGAVINDKGQFLTIQRRDNLKWELPGGVLEFGETPESGVIREVEEETGIIVSVDRLSGVYKNMSRGIIALVFRCRIVGGSLRITSEAVDVKWMTPQEVTEHMVEAFAVRLLDALTDGHVPIRHHDGVKLV